VERLVDLTEMMERLVDRAGQEFLPSRRVEMVDLDVMEVLPVNPLVGQADREFLPSNQAKVVANLAAPRVNLLAG
jgi:hypothetical protein